MFTIVPVEQSKKFMSADKVRAWYTKYEDCEGSDNCAYPPSVVNELSVK